MSTRSRACADGVDVAALDGCGAGARCRARRRRHASGSRPGPAASGRCAAGARAGGAAGAASRPPARRLRSQRPHLLTPAGGPGAHAPTSRARSACTVRCQRAAHFDTAKSSRGWSVHAVVRSLRSSMTLMPPTKATSPSTTHSFWCRRRSWPGCSHDHQRSSGRKTSSSHAAARVSDWRRAAAAWPMVPKPSTTTCTATPRAAAARAAPSATAGAGHIVVEDVGGQPDLALAPGRWPRTCAGTARRRLAAARRGCRPPTGGAARRLQAHSAVSSRAAGTCSGRLEFGHQRQVIGHARPGHAARHHRRHGSAARAGRSGRARRPGRSATERSPAPAACRRAALARCRPQFGASRPSSFSPQSLKSPATTSGSSCGTSALDESRPAAAAWRTRLRCTSPKCTTTACTVMPFHCTGTCSRPRCSKRWSLTSWWPTSPIGQRDSSALPCSPCRVTALLR